jgi:hypothetical protein
MNGRKWVKEDDRKEVTPAEFQWVFPAVVVVVVVVVVVAEHSASSV